MVNRNAARHLLLVVSFLLLVFVYLGYRLRKASGTPVNDTATELESADLAGDNSAAQRLFEGLKPPDEPRETTGASLLPPGLLGGDASPAEEWTPSIRDEESSPIESMGLIPSPPSESASEPSSATNSGSITGLIPAPAHDAISGLRPAADDSPEPARDSAIPELTLPGMGHKPAVDEGDSPTAFDTEDMPPFSARPPASDDTTFLATAPGEPSAHALGAAASHPSSGRETSSFRPVAATQTTRPSPVHGTGAPSPATREDAPPPPNATPGGAAVSESLRVYVIRPGDTLSSIAARELGSASLADNIFFYNRTVISNPDQLMVGMKINLPVREGAPGTRQETFRPGSGDDSPPPRKPNQGLGRVHKVVRGDTLSSISEYYYGTSAGWRFLYEANKNILPDPNRLSLGMELAIPPYEE